MSTMNPSMADARRRHPSARMAAPVDVLRHRVAQFLDLRGARHADVAASLLAARGRLGWSREEFARRFAIEVEFLRQAEVGAVSEGRLPGRLRRLVRSP